MHEVRRQTRDLAVPHLEYVAEEKMQDAATLRRGAHAALGHHDILLLDQPGHRDGRTAHEGVVLDLLVEGGFARDAKCSGNEPLDVIGQARQDGGVIGPAERVHIVVDRLLVSGHQ